MSETVRSYRHARRYASRIAIGRSWLSFTLPQIIGAFVGGAGGVVVGLLVLPGASFVFAAAAGLVGGGAVGSHRRDGRDVFQTAWARAHRRPGVWSPMWGSLRAATVQRRWRCTVTAADVAPPSAQPVPRLELLPARYDRVVRRLVEVAE